VPAVPATIDGIAEVMALVGRERFAEALAILDARPGGDEPDVVLVHAMLCVHAGQLDAAEAQCRRLLAAEASAPPPPCVAGAHHVLSLCCEAAGDRRSAAVHGRTAVRADPTFAMPRLHLGLAARRAGDVAAARSELGQALVLLERESASRLLLFGGGFDRDALIALCRKELAACGAPG
jgi:chemotaxis protein methyltransferase CheR